MKLPVLLILMVGLLSACEQTKTKDYYLDHPDEIARDLNECAQAGKNTFNCNEATLAQFQLKQQKH